MWVPRPSSERGQAIARVAERKQMIRITAHQERLATRLCLEGKLSGDSVDVLDECWQSASTTANSISVDLTDISFIDSRGKQLLVRMFEKGTRLVSRSLMGRCLIEEINGAIHENKLVP